MKVEKQFGKFICTDEDRGIRITLQEFDGKGYEKTAHVEVGGLTAGGRFIPIIEGRTGITSVATRRSFAQIIERDVRGNEKTGDEGMQGIFGINSPVVSNDWRSSITEAFREALAMYNAGRPPIMLYDKESEEDDVWRIPGLISEDINVLYGDSGSGKSYLSIIWGQAIHHGVPVCDLRTIKGNVLLLDWETTESKMRRRMKRVDEGLGIEGECMLYTLAEVPLVAMLDSLEKIVVEYNIEFIIIDSLAKAVGAKITDEENVTRFFDAIRLLGRPCIIIHHTNKGDDYYGSPYIKANARNMWRLRSVQNEGQQELSIQLQQEKENDGPGLGNIGFLLKFEGDPFDPDAVTLKLQDASQVPQFRRYSGLTERLRVYLEETPNHRMRHDEVKDILELTKPQQKTFRTYVWDLTTKSGKYKLLTQLMHIDGEYICLNTELGSSKMLIPEIVEEVLDVDDPEERTLVVI